MTSPKSPLADSAFIATTFVTLDFETLTPAGRKPEPIEIALIGQRWEPSGWAKTTSFDALIKPPADVPVTRFTTQTGITTKMLATADSAASVMTSVEQLFSEPPYVLVAHNANYEAALIFEQRAYCPLLARIPLLDTVRLARIVYPELSQHRLDNVLSHLNIAAPVPRHRAMPDTQATAELFIRIVEDGAERGLWSTLEQLMSAGSIPAKLVKLEAEAARPQQGTLFG